MTVTIDLDGYGDFLRAKCDFDTASGFDVDPHEISTVLMPHQRDIVRWALHGGRRAIFAAFGLGKSVMQLEVMRLIHQREHGQCLIVCPLGVRQEFIRDARQLLDIDVTFVRHTVDVDGPGIYLTNYESIRDGRLDPSLFDAVSLDEASVLRSFGSKTYQTFLTLFADTKYRFVATATPSPNRYKELIHYAGFLGVMDTGQALAQPLDAQVLTPTGWQAMGDLRVGDQVIAGDGTPTEVIGVFPQGEQDIYRVSFSDGTSTYCTAEHLWLTRTQYERNNAARFLRRNPDRDASEYWTTKPTDEIARTLINETTGSKNHEVPLVGAVRFDEQKVAVDPWLLGLLIGDGSLRETSVVLTTADEWIRDEAARIVGRLGLSVTPVAERHWTGTPNYSYQISGGKAGRTGRGHRSNMLLNGLRGSGLLGKRAWEKRIPPEYLFNTPDIRLAVLQGLMDADGTIVGDGTQCRLTTTSEGLADDVRFIVRSLGGTCSTSERLGMTPSGRPGRWQYRITVQLPNGVVPFRLPRKAQLVTNRSDRNRPARYVTAIEFDGVENAQCIAVAHPDHLYVTDDFIVTHNTRFFQRDSTKANHLTLYPHKEGEFWLWLHSWAIFLQRPSDLGYPDAGYDLPPLEVVWHEVPVVHGDGGHDRDGQGRIFRDTTLGVSEAAREKRETMDARVAKLVAILEAYGHLGATPAVSAGLLRGEPGTAPGRAARAQPAQLPVEQGSVCGDGPAEPAEEIRADRGGVRGPASGSGVRVPDLRADNEPAGRRPRSRDRRDPRSAVQDVQHGDRTAPRGHVGAAERDRVLDQVVIWCDLNAEQRAIENALRRHGLTYSSVDGSLDPDEVERRIDEWRDRRTYALIGKPVMLGQGMNLQQCNKAIFVGVTHKFNQTIQATHRIHRFGQQRTAEVHFIYAESEREVVKALVRKWRQDEELRERMTDIIKEHQLDGLSVTEVLARSIGVERVEASGEGWTAVNNDCVVETAAMAPASVDLIVTSIPFSNHYEYTPSYNDFGHTDDNGHFWAQMDHLTPHLLRVLAPGRIYACHVKDRILFGNTTGKGYSTVSPFHAEAIAHNIGHGFDYLGMITVVTDVVRENNQSYRLGWSEQCRDGTRMGVGSPEYVLIFRAPQSDRTQGRADRPVTKTKDDYSRSRWQTDAHAFWRSNGDRQLAPEDFDGLSTAERYRLFESWTAANLYDHELHVRIGEHIDGKGQLPATFMLLAPASPDPDVWADINRMLTLNGAQSQQGRALHVCPMQFDIVDRLIERYSNPGDLVYDPFGGLMTVPVRALHAGRQGRGVELNGDYWRDGVRYLQAEEITVGSPTLFDLIADEAADLPGLHDHPA